MPDDHQMGSPASYPNTCEEGQPKGSSRRQHHVVTWRRASLQQSASFVLSSLPCLQVLSPALSLALSLQHRLARTWRRSPDLCVGNAITFGLASLILLSDFPADLYDNIPAPLLPDFSHLTRDPDTAGYLFPDAPGHWILILGDDDDDEVVFDDGVSFHTLPTESVMSLRLYVRYTTLQIPFWMHPPCFVFQVQACRSACIAHVRGLYVIMISIPSSCLFCPPPLDLTHRPAAFDGHTPHIISLF
ncbi:hypothetical protein BO78DRAFT_132895 [Aspergillus sclerotiicarbonarius CBS 121057]|uniref:Uncharacterized protein n=1 Tax=Aspergillus sclerotiicarbonarius (strain CBS 121057 / IBT 28362) TaxID=1448318 RepID=A0A319ENY6_ASPSB|nr:hypothetical protein BO78DRAFT_132895 [Aspergillus sclerotiicarbonarius CBS 121057]